MPSVEHELDADHEKSRHHLAEVAVTDIEVGGIRANVPVLVTCCRLVPRLLAAWCFALTAVWSQPVRSMSVRPMIHQLP